MSGSESGGRPMRGGQPVFILGEDSQRTHGQDAQSANISAGRAIAEAVRTTLGPKGMDKMLVDDSGGVVVTNDGATILEEMDIEHPAAKMLVEVAESQEEDVGDGTTTAAILAGELLSEAEEFLDQDIHPTTIVEGYKQAQRIALETIDEQVLEGGEVDDELLQQVAESSMTGKGTGDVAADVLASAIVDAARQVETDAGVERDRIRVVTQTGQSATATRLVEGVVVDADREREDMPKVVEDATIAVIDRDLEPGQTEVDAEFSLTSTDQLTDAIESEQAELRGYAEALAGAGVDVAFVSGDVEDRTARYLANEGILAFDGLDADEIDAVVGATGASYVTDVEGIEADELGHADSVSVEVFDEDEHVFVEGGAAAESVTLFVRGGTEHVTDELERAINDGVDVVVGALSRGGVVPGAAGTELAVADALRDAAAGIEGRKQLAVEAYADAMDAIPRTLAQNAGMDPVDAVVDLRAAYEDSGRAGIIATGDTGEIGDPVAEGVVDPTAVKREAVASATEAATMIIRIDDVISADVTDGGP